jgi:hypothetical protein
MAKLKKRIEMIKKNIILVSMISAVLIISLTVSISVLFITALLGLLILPPLVAFILVFKEGLPLIISGGKSLFKSGKEFLLISISKDHITLEPQLR